MNNIMSLKGVLYRHRLFLSLIFIGAFVVRAAVFMWYLGHDERYWQVDSLTYHTVAQHIAQGKGYVNKDGSPHFYRLPGYPLLIASSYALCGENKKTFLWIQMFFASFIPVLTFLLAAVLFPGVLIIARAASIFVTLHLGFVLYAGFFMTESFFILFFLLFLIFFLRAFHCFFCRSREWIYQGDQPVPYENVTFFLPEPLMGYEGYMVFNHESGDSCPAYKNLPRQFFEGDPGVKSMIFAGLFLGFASLFRPVGHYALLTSFFVILMSNDRLKGKILKALVFSCAWLLPISLWLLRNVMLTGYLFFHTLPGGHFLYLSAARVAMHVHDCSYQDARALLSEKVQKNMAYREKTLGRPLQEIERCYEHEKLAMKYFKKDTTRALQNWFTDIFRTMFSLYSSELVYLDSGRVSIDYFQKDRPFGSLFERYIFPKTSSRFIKMMIWTELEFFIIILLGFMWFCIRAFYRAWLRKYNLLCALMRGLPFMAMFVLIALAGGYSRMRLPIESLLIIYSCAGWFSRNRKGDHVD